MQKTEASREEKAVALCMDSPVGRLMIVQQGEAVKEILFEEKITDAVPIRSTELLLCAQRQLNEYFSGSRKVFSLPLALTGTPFQRKVWQQLTQIPYGEVRSYGQIAQAVGNPKACRAVGAANHCNPIPILVPCHRVVGANGSLTGYAGGLWRKNLLLQLEQNSR